ncbi:unnamed protein product, partial [Phaeothamnion confervicola]
MTIDISGYDLRQSLENSLARLPAAAGRFPQVSGMIVEYDPRRPAGRRIRSIRIGGAALNLNKIYR